MPESLVEMHSIFGKLLFLILFKESLDIDLSLLKLLLAEKPINLAHHRMDLILDIGRMCTFGRFLLILEVSFELFFFLADLLFLYLLLH